MNSLSHGFLFLSGLTWLLCEVCFDAGAGYWTPVWLFLLGFTVMFAVMGCLPLSEKTINLAGPIFTILIGAGIVLYGFAAFKAGFLGAALRLLGGGVLILLAVFSLLGREKEGAAHH